MDILIKVAQLLLSLSILVILHEFGHFAFAKLFKTRVEKFYLFFDPYFSLFKFKKGETEYGIGWLPLGGYVKISGMIDESMDKEAMLEEPKPYEFRSKPAYQRLLIMLGGVMVNFLLAIFIYWMVLFAWGESYIPTEKAPYGLSFDPIATEIGLQNGDNILTVGGAKVLTPTDISRGIMLENATQLEVKRGDSIFVVQIPEAFRMRILASGVKRFADYNIPFVIDSVLPGSLAEKAKIQKGDSLLTINGENATSFFDFVRIADKNSGKTLNLSLLRGKDTISIVSEVSSSGKIGVAPKSYLKPDMVDVKEYGFFAAFPAGIDRGINTLTSYVKQMKYLFTKEGAQQVQGFGGMASLFPTSWDWASFWSTTAFFSMALAFMNILPIPALDGGHVLFLLYEMVTRRKPSDKFMEYSTYVGLSLILALMLFANGNDLFKFLFK